MKTRMRRKSSLRGATTRKATLDTKPIYANRVQAAPPNLPVITAEQCALLAKMLPNPLTPEEFKDWFDNTAGLIGHWKAVDGTNHQKMRDAWDRIKENMRESQELLGAFGDLSNVAPPEIRQVKFVRDFLKVHEPLLDGLHSIEKWAVKYLDFLEQQAREHRGGREPSKQWGYTALVQFWIARGGEPAVSRDGPLARFLIAASELIFGEAPEHGTIPGIVERAKRELKIV